MIGVIEAFYVVQTLTLWGLFTLASWAHVWIKVCVIRMKSDLSEAHSNFSES